MDRSRDNSDQARARAEARFQNAQRAEREGETRKAEAKGTAEALDQKTARLKALRLARDAAEG